MQSWQELINTKGRIMGVDFGDTRTGLAVSDESRFLASGIGYISVGGLLKTAEKTAELAREHRVSAIVVGLPVNMNGTEGPRAERAKEFALRLSELVDVPVCMMDERMTTMSAARYLDMTNTHGKKRKQSIDTLSAQIILQNMLDRLKHAST